ncbi:MAG: preprotein translocase subunit SecA [Acidimicrobiales bacterium]
MSVLTKVLRAGEGKKLRRVAEIVPLINELEPEVQALSDAGIKAKTEEFRARLAGGETLDDLLVEAFAVVREAAFRVIGQRPYDVQLMGAMALHFGWIAEMKTGEGKTLVSTLPVYLNALAGQGVHVVTVNDYLARRDAEWMGSVHRFLGLTVGLVTPEVDDWALKREAYGADVTYGTNTELGFDYLRDNMAGSKEAMVQRGHHYAIVDEIDSILIDEARTPLIISGPADEAARLYYQFASITRTLARDVDYEVDEEKETVAPTEEGITKVERMLNVDNLYDSVQVNYVHHLSQALRAKELYKRDKDYLVAGGEVRIVDEFTGRVLEGRRWSDGLHQAVEAKERVRIKEENHTWATVTLQNYFRMYEKLGGMTGTAMSEASEFASTYNLPVVPIPTAKPMVRMDQPDLIYKTEAAKFNAAVDDIEQRHAKGQPVLVGTASVEKSEVLSRLLDKRGIPHTVLNAKQNLKEAEVVAQAGRLHAVTVATNMAGRGVDILLGGNPEGLALRELSAEGLVLSEGMTRSGQRSTDLAGLPGWRAPASQPASDQPASDQPAIDQPAIDQPASDQPVPDQPVDEQAMKALLRYDELVAGFKAECRAEGDEIRRLGGLYVLGSERHESRRIDDQLRGRSGRQGDPGESRFFLSLEDDLMRLFATGAINWVMGRALPEEVPIEAKMVTKAIERAQSTVEARNAEVRKDVLKYDEVMNEQRKVVYARRMQVLDGDDLRSQTLSLFEAMVETVVAGTCPGDFQEEWDTDGMVSEISQYFPTRFTAEELSGADSRDQLVASLQAEALSFYEERETSVPGGVETMRQIEREVMLQIIDQRWREHLSEMDYLREGIGLRAMGQQDPLVAWQREGYEMFSKLMDGIDDDYLRYIGHIEVSEVTEAPDVPNLSGASYQAAEDPVGPRSFQAITDALAGLGSGDASEELSAPGGQQMSQMAGAGETEVQQVPLVKPAEEKLGRNAPCWCGSGRKFKLCHGR